MDFTAHVTGTEYLPSDAILQIKAALLCDENFAGRELVQFNAIGSTFRRCNFRNMKIAQACFGGGKADSVYTDCVFDGSLIFARAPGFAIFERCSFLNVKFSELCCMNVEFVDCVFSGEIVKGFFNGTTSNEARIFLGRERNRVVGNDFTNSKLGDVGFRSGIDLSRQKLPVGDEYIYIQDAEAVCSSLMQVEPDLDEDLRKSLGVLIKLIARDIAAGQTQLFFNSNAFPPSLLPAFAVLRQLS